MTQLIIVPLDGSEFGEQAIPIALHVAADMNAEVELVHVYEAVPPYYTQGAPPLDSALDEALRAEWQHYLERLADRLRRKTPLTIATVVLSGPVRVTLAEHVEEQRADLVAAATHGRGGLSRAWLGVSRLHSSAAHARRRCSFVPANRATRPRRGIRSGACSSRSMDRLRPRKQSCMPFISRATTVQSTYLCTS